MVKASTKCWISAFYAQGARGIIVAVQIGAVKIDVAAVEKRENHENWWFSEFQPHLNVNVLFCRFFSHLTLCMTKLRVQVLSFPDFTDISNTLLLLAASTLIILLSEMLKYSRRQFPILFFFVKENIESSRLFSMSNWKFQNYLFILTDMCLSCQGTTICYGFTRQESLCQYRYGQKADLFFWQQSCSNPHLVIYQHTEPCLKFEPLVT